MRDTASASLVCVFLTLVSCRPAAKLITIGVDDSPPFYIFQPDGSVQGLGVDVISEAARRRKIQVRWVLIRDISLDQALESRLVQMWPAITSTPVRRKKLFLSDPWIETDYVLVSPKDRPISSPRETTGLIVSHSRLQWTTTLARRHLANSNLVVFPNRVKAFQEMCLGHAAATFIESRVAEAMLLDRPAGCGNLALKIANVAGATTSLSIAAVPESAPLARELRSEISNMAIEGVLGKIMEQWAPFSAEVGRSMGIERAQAVKNRFLAVLAVCSLGCGVLLGLLAHRAHKLRRVAMAAEQEMRRQAMEDSLTHLPNRKVFMERVTRCLEQSHARRDSLFGVFFLDLDSFKVINDSLGHLTGDKLLIGVARRLTEVVGSSDLTMLFREAIVARLGGDEYVILTENIRSPESVLFIADRIQQNMSTPFILDGRIVFAAFSIGVALNRHDYSSAEDILRDADTAMYVAKASGKGTTAVFETAMRSRAIARLEMVKRY